MDAIHAALDSGADPRLLARQVVDYLRALLLVQMGNAAQVDLSAEVRGQAEKHAKAFAAPDILRMIKAFNVAASDQRGGWQPSLPLELALAEVIEAPAMPPVSPPQKPPETSEGKPKAGKPVDTPAKAQPPAANEGAITLGQVAKAWKQVSASVRNNPSLNALLNSCRLLELKNNTLMLGFASDILRAKAETPEQVEAIRKAIAEVLGVDLMVKCIVSNAKQTSRADIKPDGMVAAALKNGGEIVDVQK
jgi:DNA polymerase-3 subunit gamma/tau